MYISINKEIDKEKWNNFVNSHKYSNPFQSYEFFESFENSNIYSSIAIACIDKKTGDYKGILLAVIQKDKNKILGIFSRRSTIYGGPLFDNSNNTLNTILSVYNKLIKNRAIYTQFRNFHMFNESQILIFNKYGYKLTDHLNILLKIPETEDILWKQLDRSRKKGINKAKQNNFIFSEEEYSDVSNEFYDLLVLLYRKIKLPCPEKEYFDELHSKLGDSMIKIFSLKRDQKKIIILFSLCKNKTLYTYYMGTLQYPELIKLKPVDLFFYELLIWCVNNNYEVFDWMGAGKPDQDYGVRKFKLEYGGDVINLGRFEKTHSKLLFRIGKLGLLLLKKVT